MTIHIRVFSHALHVAWDSHGERQVMHEYRLRFVQYEMLPCPRTRRLVREPKSAYSSSNQAFTGLGLVRSDLDDLVSYLQFLGFRDNGISITYEEDYQPAKITATFTEGFDPRDDTQRDAINFAMEPNEFVRVIDADTGKGKTWLGLQTIARRGYRAALAMKSSHLETWLGKVSEYYTDVGPEDVYFIQGRDTLISAFQQAMHGQFNYKLVFISTPTLVGYIRDYERGLLDADVDTEYPHPIDIWKLLGIGTLIYDEVHEHFNSVCKLFCHLHIPYVMPLSATIDSEDEFVLRQMERVLPKDKTFISERNQHISIRPILFDSDPDAVRRMKWKGGKGYSHVMLEKSIMNHEGLLQSYLDLLVEEVRNSYIRDHKPGMKLLIFAAMTEMCDHMTNALKQAFGHLTVATYVGKTDDSVLYKNDIVVSTPGSASTGKDIKNLSHVIMTVAMNSKRAFRQLMGRLRPVDLYKDFDPICYYFVNTSIPQHVQYDKRRLLYQMGRCKVFERQRAFSRLSAPGKGKSGRKKPVTLGSVPSSTPRRQPRRRRR